MTQMTQWSFGKMAAASAALASVLMASGCVSVLPDAAPVEALVRLPSERMPAPEHPLRASVIIYRPDAPSTFSGPEIATADGELLQYIRKVRWADSPMALMQSALVDSLMAAEGEGAAASFVSGVRADYEVRWEIRDLSVSSSTKQAVCDLRVLLMTSRSRAVVATTSVRVEEGVSRRADDVERAEALARAMRMASLDAANFIAEHAEPLPDRERWRGPEGRIKPDSEDAEPEQVPDESSEQPPADAETDGLVGISAPAGETARAHRL